MAKEKSVAKEKGVKTGETEMVTLTGAHFKKYPDLDEKGFSIGQEIQVPTGTYDLDEEKEEKSEGRSKEDEASMQADPTEKFTVRSVGVGSFRLYAPTGQAVSPIVSEQSEIQRINKIASRYNAQLDAGKIATPKKKAPEQTVQ